MMSHIHRDKKDSSTLLSKFVLEEKSSMKKKVKTFWGELKRLLFCQGGNYVEDIE
jgi:hypothetical protein